MKNVLLTIEYDGTNFSGWQKQPNQRTVQGEIERVLSVLCKQDITLIGTSRTDAGVHAFGQRAAFIGKYGIPVNKIPEAANHLLAGNKSYWPGDVRILEAEEVSMKFHPRFDAAGKTYVYRILNSGKPDIMRRNFYYQINKPLNLKLMAEAASQLTGEQDFRCFMAAGGNIPSSTIRTIYRAEICKRSLDAVEVEITGNGFLYNMVRIIVGTLVEIGLGKIPSDIMAEIIIEKNRQRAGHTAPPQGLYLKEVFFDKEDMLNEDKRNV